MTVHKLLSTMLDISSDIHKAAHSLALSKYCPEPIKDCCDGRCEDCWKQYLESEVKDHERN